jgi:hypothetical protein
MCQVSITIYRQFDDLTLTRRPVTVRGMDRTRDERAQRSGPIGRTGLPISDLIGATSRERLAWLLEFAYIDLGNVNEAAHAKLWSLLAGLVRDVTKGHWRVPDSSKPEREAFRLLKSGTAPDPDEDLSYPGRLDYVQARIRGTINKLGHISHIRGIELVYFEPFPGIEHTPRLKTALTDFYFQVGLADGLMVALAMLRAETPASLVRQCLWNPARGCLRFFVATKRQKWCPLHQDAARRERDRRAQERFRERQRSRDRGKPPPSSKLPPKKSRRGPNPERLGMAEDPEDG